MDKETAWRIIGAAICNGTAPAPETVRIQAHSIHIETFTCFDVDRWATYFEMPKPRVIMNRSYGTVEFYGGNGGWFGADVISISCQKLCGQDERGDDACQEAEERGRLN